MITTIKNIAKLSAVLVLSFFFSLAANAKMKLDMPMAYSATNFHSQNGVFFADALRVATGGEIDIKVHPGGSLFKGNEIKKAVQTGQALIGERILSAHQNESAIFGTDSVPFIATSFAESEKLYAAFEPEIRKVLNNQGLELLYSVPWPPQGLYFKKEVKSIADTKGVKFRSYNNATAKIAEMMGMLPVQVEAAELSQALATGVAESFVSSGATGYDRKVWEHLTHFYEVNAWLPRNYVFMNKKAWDKLSKKDQNIIKGVAMLAQKAGTARSEQLTGWYMTQLAANGMKVQVAGDKLKGELQTIGAKMASDWEKAAGTTGQKILKTYKAK